MAAARSSVAVDKLEDTCGESTGEYACNLPRGHDEDYHAYYTVREQEARRAADDKRRTLICQMAASIAAGVTRFNGDAPQRYRQITDEAVAIAEAIYERVHKPVSTPKGKAQL